MTPKEAFDYCENIAKSHYENFPIGFLVPGKLRKYVYSIYAFARFADDLADDEKLPIEERKSALDAWTKMLNACYSGNTEHPIYIALKETIFKFNIPKQLLEDLLTAFKMDLDKTRYNNFDEILFYCKHSANPIGRLILILFGKDNDETCKYSDSICTALQIANFLQDVSLDIQKDRIYFPLDNFQRFNYTEEEFLNKKNNSAFQNIFEAQIKKTEELFNHGENLIKHLDGRLKLEIILTLEGGRTILKKAKSYRYKIFDERPKINTFEKLILFIKTIIKWILM